MRTVFLTLLLVGCGSEDPPPPPAPIVQKALGPSPAVTNVVNVGAGGDHTDKCSAAECNDNQANEASDPAPELLIVTGSIR